MLDGLDVRQVERRRDVIVQQRGGELLAGFVVEELFHAGVADAHRDAAMNLAAYHHRVDRLAGIVHRHVAHDLVRARVGKHLDLRGVDVATVHAGGLRLEVRGVLQAGFHARRQSGGRQQGDLGDLGDGDAPAFVPAQHCVSVSKHELVGSGFDVEQVGGDDGHFRLQRAGGQHRGAQRVRGAARADRAGRERAGMRVAVGDVHVFRRQAEFAGHDLCDGRLVALPVGRIALGDLHLAVRIELDRGDPEPRLALHRHQHLGRNARNLDAHTEADAGIAAGSPRLGLSRAEGVVLQRGARLGE